MSGSAKSFVLLLSFAGLLLGATNANALACTSVATGNWGVAGTWTSAGNCNRVPTAADTVTIATGHTVTVNAATANVLSVTVDAGAILAQTQALSTAGVLSVAGTLTSNNAMTITGATTVTGALNIVGAGARTFTGLVTVTGGTWNNSGNQAVTFRGGVTNNGTFTAGAGTQTFNLTQAIGGANPINFGGIVAVVGAVTVTNNNTNTVTIAGNLTGSVAGSTWVNAANSTLNYGGALAPMGTRVFTASAVPNTVNYNGAAAQAVKTANYNNLTVTKAAGIAATTAAGTVNVTGVLTVTSGTLNIAGTTVAVTGTTNVSGTLGITNATGTKTFTGPVTVNAGGVWTNTTEAVTFRGGLAHNGATFTAGTGIYTFDTVAAQSVSCAVALMIPSVTVTAPTVLTNNCNLTVSTALGGTGTLTNAATGILNIGGTSAITTLNAATAGNIVNYTGGVAQTIKATAYDTLNTSGAGAKSTAAAAVVTVNNTLSVTGGALTNNGTLTVVTALSGTGTLINAGTRTLNIGGTSTITTLTATAAGNIVNYTGVAQTIKPTSYATLNVTGTATNSGTVTVATALGGTGTLTNAATGILNIGGTSLITGLDAIAAGNVVNYTGGAAQAVKATTYATLNFSGAGVKTNSGIVTVNTALTGTALTNGATGTLNIGGTSTITTLTATAAGNTVNYTGAAQTVKATTYHHLGLGGSGAKAMGATTINGNFTMSGTATTAPTGALTVGGNFSIGAINTFANGANALNVAGNFVQDGTFTAGAGVVTLNGGAAVQTISGTGPFGFANLTVSNTGITLARNVTVTSAIIGAVTLTSTCPTDYTLTSNGGATVAHSCPPTVVVSINLADPNPTNAASVSWTVIFSTSVTGVSSGNFALVNAGLGGAPAITSAIGSGTTWTVTASTGSGDGTLGLNMVNSTGVSPAITGLPSTGQVYTLDRTAPAVSSIVRADPNPTSQTSVSWTVTFSESVTGVDTTDFALVPAGGVSGATITLASGSGATWTVSANTGSGSGTLGLNLADNDSIVDATNNPLGGAGLGNGNFTGEIYTINAAPAFQAAGTAVGGAATVSPVWPPHAIDDLALLFVESAGGEAATLSVPAGFAPVLNTPQATGTTTAGTRITVFWARATSAAMTAPTVADPGNHVYAQIITYRGVINTGDPWDVTGGGVKAAASAAVTVTGVTTTVPGTLIVQAVARGNDSAAAAFSAQTNANLTGIAERSDAGTALGNGGGFAVWDGVKAAAGATGNTTATVTSSINAFLTIALKPVPLAPAVADHFSVNHSGTGVTCQAEPITVAAHDASHNIFTTQTASITLSTSTGLGDWSLIGGGGTLTPGAVNSGSAVYAFVAGDNGQVTLGLKHTAAASVSLGVTDGTATLVTGAGAGEADPPVVYSDAGFSVTDSAGNPVNIGSQVAGQTSGALYLQAVKTAPNGACTGVFNTTVNIEMASQCNNPAACAGKQVTVNATALNAGYPNSTVPGGSGLAGVNVPLVFGANSIAPFTLNYPDVGQVKLYARYNMPLRDGSGSGNYMVGNSNPFVVKPGGFALSGIMRTSDSFANPAAADAAGAKFVKAGEVFTATVTATTIDGVTPTPNYGKETPAEGVRFVDTSLPSTDPNYANHGTLVAGLGLTNNPAIGGTFGAFGNGAAIGVNFAWNEAGIITLTPSVADADYLGTGDVIGTTSGNVGRFIPDHFDTAVVATATVPMPCPSDLTCPVLYNGFIYSGQPFSVKVSARNTAACSGIEPDICTTRNYQGAFARTATLSAWDAPGGTTPNPGSGVSANNTVASTAFISGIGATATLTYTFNTSLTAPTDIYIRADEPGGADGVSSLRVSSSIEGGVKAVSGRIKISNAHGSELLPLLMTATVQYYNGMGWVTSATDSATQFNTNLSTAGGNIVATIVKGPLAAVSVMSPALVTVAVGLRTLTLTKPMVAGAADVSLDAPVYLPSNTGRATFGVYKGNHEFIYLREAY